MTCKANGESAVPLMAARPRPPSNMASATTAFGALRALPSSGNPEEDDHAERNLAKPGTRGGKSSNRRGKYMLLGLALATWMESYTYDGVNLVLPDMAGTLGVSQDQASWILTTYLSALVFGVPL
jgi:hypothetical protein